MTVVDILVKYHVGLLHGLFVTCQLGIIIMTTGIVCGTLMGVAGAKWKAMIGALSRLTSFFLSGVPILVLLFWLHYPLQVLLNVVIDPFITASAALSFVNTFAVADLVRGAIGDFPAQYLVAARVCGVSSKTTFWRIQLPLILRQILPGLLILQVNMLQATLFCSLISVEEIFRVAQRINAVIYKPVEIYTALGILFLAICLPINGLALWLRWRYTRDVSER